MDYYHCSSKHFKVGHILTAQHHRELLSGGVGIYVSTKPEPHSTIYPVPKGTRLYRVRPLGKVVKGTCEDLICKVGVEIVESLGEAPRCGKRSFVENGKGRTVKPHKKSNKNRWGVYRKYYPMTGGNTYKLVKGFKCEKHAQNWARKKGEHYVAKRKDSVSYGELES